MIEKLALPEIREFLDAGDMATLGASPEPRSVTSLAADSLNSRVNARRGMGDPSSEGIMPYLGERPRSLGKVGHTHHEVDAVRAGLGADALVTADPGPVKREAGGHFGRPPGSPFYATLKEARMSAGVQAGADFDRLSHFGGNTTSPLISVSV